MLPYLFELVILVLVICYYNLSSPESAWSCKVTKWIKCSDDVQPDLDPFLSVDVVFGFLLFLFWKPLFFI